MQTFIICHKEKDDKTEGGKSSVDKAAKQSTWFAACLAQIILIY